MKFARAGLLVAAAVLSASIPMSATAGVLPFGATNTFESGAIGSQPGEFHDGNTGWHGDITIQSSGTDSVTTNPSVGGSQFAKVTAGPDDSYPTSGYRNGPYGHIGANSAHTSNPTPFPTSGDTFRVFVDIFTKAADFGTSGNFVWQNGVNNLSGSLLTEAGFNITPGEAGWNAIARGTSGSAASLTVDTWYTFEVIFDRSGTDVVATHNIYEQGGSGGTPFYSVLSTPANDLSPGTPGAPSSQLGGLRYSWFTVWDNDAVDQIYIDNIGSGPVAGPVVPEPTSLALLGIGGVGLTLTRRLRRKQAA